MGLKRRNPARNRLFTPPQMLAVLSGPVANEQARPAPASPPPPPMVDSPAPRAVSGEERHRMIATAAYGHAERTGFAGDPVANWLVAEREVDAFLSRKAS